MKCKRCERPLKRGRRLGEYCAFCLEGIVREWEGWKEDIDTADAVTIQRVIAINGSLQAIVDRLTNFSPTAAQVNALPEKLRDYIHGLETICDPSRVLAALVRARKSIEALTKQNQELTEELGHLRSR